MSLPAADDSSPPPSSDPKWSWLGLLARLSLPLLFLLGGVYAYQLLSIEVAKEEEPPAENKSIRTRVVKLVSQDYPVVIKKNGIVQPHNQVLLSAEVSGQVTAISSKFEVGAYFEAGDLLVEIDQRDYINALELAKAQLAGAKAALQLADLDLERQKKLVRREAASVAELNQAVATKAQAEATLDSAETSVKQAEQNLQRTKIVAPFNGRVRQRDVGLGQSVAAGAPLGVVFAVDFAEVRLPVAGPELKFLDLPEREGDTPVQVSLRDGINPANQAIWTARIVRTEGALDENSLELFAIARIDDPFGLKSGDPPLRIGQPVIGSITGKTLHDVIAVPRISVRQMDQVYLIDGKELTITSKTIQPIWSDEDYMLIRDPNVKDGTLVATTRIIYAPDGAKVELIADRPTEDPTATKTARKDSKDSQKATN